MQIINDLNILYSEYVTWLYLAKKLDENNSIPYLHLVQNGSSSSRLYSGLTYYPISIFNEPPTTKLFSGLMNYPETFTNEQLRKINKNIRITIFWAQGIITVTTMPKGYSTTDLDKLMILDYSSAKFIDLESYAIR